jgi:signal transduction histidine kinase
MDITRRWDRGRLADAALVLVCLALTGLAVKGRWSTLPWPVIVVAGVVGSVVQWRRRSWPEVAAVVGAVAYTLSGNPGPALVGLYSGGSYAPRRRVWALAAVGWLGFVTQSLIDDHHLEASFILFSAVGAAFVVGLGLYTAARRALTESWRERAVRAESERRLHEERARAAERTRIAREMHDVVAHKVSLIALHAGALELTATAGPDRVEQEAALIRQTAREALSELRTVLGLLNDPASDQAEAGEPFADLVSLVDASARAGQHVELDDRAGPLPAATARVVYRIAQEGLTNARKYAPQAQTTVTVEHSDDSVAITVRNSATARPPMDLPSSGRGLLGLAERVRLAGGTIHSGHTDDGGWQIRATLPAAAPVPTGGPAQ